MTHFDVPGRHPGAGDVIRGPEMTHFDVPGRHPGAGNDAL